MLVRREQDPSLVRRLVEEMLNEGNRGAVDELVAPDFVDQGAAHPRAPGPEGVQRTLADLRVVTDDVLAEGDRVVARLRTETTHAGLFRRFPPTPRHLGWTTISIVPIGDGKIRECCGLMVYRSLRHQFAE
jgi:hypothetical protein